jgi:hypothetical protein
MKVPHRALVAGLLLVLCSVGGTATAADITPRCPSPASSELLAMLRGAPDAVVFEFRDRQAKLGIRLFDSLPPRENEAGDRFYIAMRPGFPFSRVIVAEHGCIETAALVDFRVAIAIKKAIKRFVLESSI